MIKQYLDVILHLDKHLVWIFQNYGIWTYGFLFLIIFCETGLVIAPFLPGDSLLFAIGTFAATGSLRLSTLIILLSIAAILGDTVNYWVGHHLGKRAWRVKWLNKEYLKQTEDFYERHGGKTIILARFLPIIRTFAPFVAGVGKMAYPRFLLYNVTGGIAWISIFLTAGYYFGNIPFVKDNFSLVILAIIILSLIPAVREFFRQRKGFKKRTSR